MLKERAELLRALIKKLKVNPETGLQSGSVWKLEEGLQRTNRNCENKDEILKLHESNTLRTGTTKQCQNCTAGLQLDSTNAHS